MSATAAILAIGDELVSGRAVDTNSPWLARRLGELGVDVVAHRTVGDDRAGIADAVIALSKACDLLILTGGLGPTEDDLTRQALGDVLTPDEDLIEDRESLRHLREWFQRRGREPAESNRRLALRPSVMLPLANEYGTALGLVYEGPRPEQIGGTDDIAIVALPGPPFEMQPMFEASVRPIVADLAGESGVLVREVQCCGLGESDIADRLGELMQRGRNPAVGTMVGTSHCTCRVRGRGALVEIDVQIKQTIETIEARLSPYAFGRDEESLAAAVGRLLQDAGATLCTAESCSGGLLGSMIVDVPGSSAYYLGGWVTYSNAMKVEQLGVNADDLERHGAVSDVIARAMAEGALARSKATYALSITGVAGPAGGTADKPVGTVWIGLGRRSRNGSVSVDAQRFHIPGGRTVMRQRTAMTALQWLRFALLGCETEHQLSWQRMGHPGANTAGLTPNEATTS